MIATLPKPSKQQQTNLLFAALKKAQWKAQGYWTERSQMPRRKPYNPKPYPKIIGASQSVDGTFIQTGGNYLAFKIGNRLAIITESDLEDAYEKLNKAYNCFDAEAELKALIYLDRKIYSESGDFLRHYEHPEKDSLRQLVKDFVKILLFDKNPSKV